MKPIDSRAEIKTHSHEERVEMPRAKIDGEMDGLLEVATAVVADMVDPTTDARITDLAILDAKTTGANINAQGVLDTEQELKVLLTVKVRNGARMALDVLSQTHAKELDVTLTPRKQDE
ncbi:MAG: hypothetical protein AAF658_11530 [Myxococcota bacterium]